MAPNRKQAFTLLELLVAMGVTVLITVVLLQVVNTSSRQWKATAENAAAFQSARTAFDTITRTLSQATLNIEYDYYNAQHQSRMTIAASLGGNKAGWDAAMAAFVPDRYGRASGLHFISGKALVNTQHTHAMFFQCPLDFDTDEPDPDALPEEEPAQTGGRLNASGAQGQLNAVGYFIRYEDDSADRPDFISTEKVPLRHRFRLMQFFQPASRLDTYRDATGSHWFTQPVNATPAREVHLLAENIVALVILPKLADESHQPDDALTADYEYNSRTAWSSGDQPIQMHQLPPVVRVIMVAIDEASAIRNPALGETFGSLFQKVDQLYADPDGDLKTVEDTLIRARANYRIFQADVAIRAAKWSL